MNSRSNSSSSKIGSSVFLGDDAAFLAAVGRRIKDRRAHEGINQVDLARLIGMPQSQVSDIERGERSLRVEQLRAIAIILRASMSYLLGE